MNIESLSDLVHQKVQEGIHDLVTERVQEELESALKGVMLEKLKEFECISLNLAQRLTGIESRTISRNCPIIKIEGKGAKVRLAELRAFLDAHTEQR